MVNQPKLISNRFKISQDFLVILLLVIVVSSLFLPIVFESKGIFHNDQAMSEFMHRYFFADNLQKGIIPLWDPHVWAGANFHYSFSYAGENYYFALWPFYLMADLDNLGHSYFMISILPLFIHYLLAAIGMFVLLRKIIKCSCLSSLTGAIIYLFSPALVYSYVCESRVIIESLLPWLIIIYMGNTFRRQWPRLCLGGLVFFFICVSGCIQDLPFVLIIWGGFVVASICINLAKKRKKAVRQSLIPALIIFILGILLSSVYFFSLLDGAKYFKIRPELVTGMRLAYLPANLSFSYLITLFIPNFYGSISGVNFIFRRLMFWYANMSGGMGISLAVALGVFLPIFFARKMKNKNYLIYAILGIALYVLSILLSLGANSPFYKLFIGWVPIVGGATYPIRYRFIQCFFAAVLAALGIHFLTNYDFRRLREIFPKFVLGYFIFILFFVSLALFLPRQSSGEFWIGKRGTKKIEGSVPSGEWAGVYTSRKARVKKVGLFLKEKSKGEIRYSDNHYDCSLDESFLVKKYNIQEKGWVEFNVDVPANKFLWVFNDEGNLGFWQDDTPSFFYSKDKWIIQPQVNAISLYQKAGPGGPVSLFFKLKNSYIEKKPIVRSFFYWIFVSFVLIAGGYLFLPKSVGFLLTVIIAGESLVFGMTAFFGSTFNEAQTRTREFLPHNVRALNPLEHPMFQRMSEKVLPLVDNSQLRIATDYPFYDNLGYLTDNFFLMGEPAHFLDARFRRAIEAAYQEQMSMGFFYDGGGFLPKGGEFLNNFSVGYFLSGHKGRIFDKEEVISFQDQRKYYFHINKNVLPRAYSVTRVVPASEERQFGELISGDLGEVVYVPLGSDIGNKQISQKVVYNFNQLQEKNKIRKINYENPNKISVDINVTVASMLVFSEVWHPGWKAAAGGRAKKVYRVNYCQRGVWLDPGNHNLVLFFNPKGWQTGGKITLITIIFIIFLLSVKALAKKKKRLNDSEI
ncbi:MAG: hypothetical protein K9L87_00140 [Candidatus Omnitrophica bacterium]|nr:hypothetical protein [Candidatus Omnitrophota bacterium]